MEAIHKNLLEFMGNIKIILLSQNINAIIHGIKSNVNGYLTI